MPLQRSSELTPAGNQQGFSPSWQLAAHAGGQPATRELSGDSSGPTTSLLSPLTLPDAAAHEDVRVLVAVAPAPQLGQQHCATQDGGGCQRVPAGERAAHAPGDCCSVSKQHGRPLCTALPLCFSWQSPSVRMPPCLTSGRPAGSSCPALRQSRAPCQRHVKARTQNLL